MYRIFADMLGLSSTIAVWIICCVLPARADTSVVVIVDLFGYTEPMDASIVVDGGGKASYWRYQSMRRIVVEARSGNVTSERQRSIEELGRTFLRESSAGAPGSSLGKTEGEPFRLVVSWDGQQRQAAGVLPLASDGARKLIAAALAIGNELEPIPLAAGYLRLIPMEPSHFAELVGQDPAAARSLDDFDQSIQPTMRGARRHPFQMQPLASVEYEDVAAWDAGPFDRLLTDGTTSYALELYSAGIAR